VRLKVLEPTWMAHGEVNGGEGKRFGVEPKVVVDRPPSINNI
jgi:hypothetical protein